MIPDISDCFRLMAEYGMLPNIRRHSVMVARVAHCLIAGLRQQGALISKLPDSSLVIAGALLHDIAKTPCLRTGGDHALIGAEICEHLGYPEIARIVEEHVVLRDHDPQRNQRGVFTASELIYYADKRVRHEEIVGLSARLDYILDRYSGGDPQIELRIRENFVRCQALEHALFSFLAFSADQLAGLVHSAGERAPALLFSAEAAMAFAGGAKAGSQEGIRGDGP